MTLYIDFETRSEVDVQSVGTHKYAMHLSTDVVLVSWAVDDGAVKTEEEVSEELRGLLEDPTILKIAHNAEFELAICKYVLGIDVNPYEWFDTAYQAAYFGYPRRLSHLTQQLGTTRKASSSEMLLFATPLCESRKAQSDELFASDYATVWRTKETNPEEWGKFLDYSRIDVEAMRECYKRLPKLPDIELFTMRFTFEMNFAGVPFDLELSQKIQSAADTYSSVANADAFFKYGIKNLRSTSQVQDALYAHGVLLISLNKKERAGVDHEILRLRDAATGAAFSKIKTAQTRLCYDNRLRGEFVGYGAHTGRWSSRGVQLQNFPRILSDVSADLSNVRSYDHLRQHMRLCIHAPKNFRFICADLSQIEARIVAWLAGCKWRMDAFAADEDIYSRSAERMFGLPHVDKSMPERQMGKCAELGLGYGGGGNAINRIAPDFYREQGSDKVADIVRRWRNANPEICELWRSLEKAFKSALTKGMCISLCGNTKIVFKYDGRAMVAVLPSGRALYYRNVYSTPEGLFYRDYSSGVEYGSLNKLWGGILLENVTQAIARDVLVEMMRKIREGGYPHECIGTVHDEVWYLARSNYAIDDVLKIMAEPISWARGLITKGDGFVSDRYIK